MEPPYTIVDFHHVARKQLATAAAAALADSKLRESELNALLFAARSLCRDDIERAGRLALHGLDQASDGKLSPADEAYLSLAAGDPAGDSEWLSATYWLSDLVLADRDPERVRAAVAAIKRSLKKLNAWLAEHDEPTAAMKPTPKGKPKARKSAESPDS